MKSVADELSYAKPHQTSMRARSNVAVASRAKVLPREARSVTRSKSTSHGKTAVESHPDPKRSVQSDWLTGNLAARIQLNIGSRPGATSSFSSSVSSLRLRLKKSSSPVQSMPVGSESCQVSRDLGYRMHDPMLR